MTNEFKLSGIADECADTLDEQLKMHKSLGWRYVEIRNVNRTTIDTTDEDSFHQIMGTLAENNIKVSCLASDIGKLTLGEKEQPFENDITTLKKMIGYAQKLDCKYIRVMGYKRGNVSDIRWRDEGIERLSVLSTIASKYNIFLALENCVGWYADSGEKMAEYIDKIGNKHCICLYDTGNPQFQQGISAWNFYEAVRDQIGYIHIKDSNGSGKGFNYPGMGMSDVFRTLEDQYKRGYKGFVSIEPHMAPSAHLPGISGNVETSWDIYGQYGRTLNEMVRTIGKQ